MNALQLLMARRRQHLKSQYGFSYGGDLKEDSPYVLYIHPKTHGIALQMKADVGRAESLRSTESSSPEEVAIVFGGDVEQAIFNFRGGEPLEVVSWEELARECSLPPSRPPINTEFILHLLLRGDEQDAVIGDLLERHGRKCARLGKRRADFWFCCEVFWTSLPLLKRALFKLGGLAALSEWVRRHIS